MTIQPTFLWDVSGGGTINSSGLFTASSSSGGPFTVSATASSVIGNASVTVIDTVAPIISGVTSSAITTSVATISWTTDENSDSQVEYGLTSSYGSATTLDGSMLTAHSQILSGLSSNTLYHYRVKSKDASGNLATSGDFNFTTLTPPDTTPPTVSLTA